MVLYVLDTKAQVEIVSEWDSLFRHLRLQSVIKHSCLWEYGCTDTGLLRFEGNDNEDTLGFEQWSAMYEHWQNSVMNTNLIPIEKNKLIPIYNLYLKRGLIAVPALLAEGARFAKGAFENENLKYDSSENCILVKDPAKAFENRTVFMAAPFVQSFSEKNPKLFFSDSFFYTNTGLTIREIHWKLNDGKYVSAVLNAETPLALHDGVNELSLVYFLSNGATHKSRIKLLLYEIHASFGNTQLMSPLIGDEHRNIYAMPYRTTEMQEPLGAYVEVLPGFENGIAHSCIKKPLIFVEGIDFGYPDHPTGCYGGKCGSIGLRDLLRGMIYNPYETNLKNVMEEWSPISRAPKLIENLRKAGYDLIYLDFHNGADYIENNAMLLIELIRIVNQIKCGKEEIAIIGASMGGLLTRFALAYMEKNNMPHCVRLFLSFDSPQNGASIPLGLQHCLKYYRKKLPGIRDKFDRKLDRAASRQMLVQHCLSENGYKEHADRIEFLSNLGRVGGYPHKCRKIALLNGSIVARKQDFNSGDVLLKMNPYLGRMNLNALQLTSTVYANSAMIEGKSVVLIAQYPLARKNVVIVPFELPRYDHIPGSLRYDLEESRDIYGLFNVINKKDATCFIPSHSALGLYNTDLSTDISSISRMDKPDPKNHPFDAYFGESVSQEHMMITANNINWILEQLESNRNELPEELDKMYNFGLRQRNRVSDLNVKEGGVLCVNCKGRTGFGNGRFDQVNLYGSDYDMYTTDCGPFVRIFNQARLEIGAESGQGGNTGKLHVVKGSVLELMPGSVLLVHDYSELIIEEGGELILHPNARMILDGQNAKIRIDGFLRLKESAVLSIETASTGKKGYLHFRNMGNGYGAATVLMEGDHIQVDLKGNGISLPILQIEGILRFGQIHNMEKFNIENAQITYGNNSLLEVRGESVFDKVGFKLLPWVNTRQTSCLKLMAFAHSKVVNSVYDKFNIALNAESRETNAVLELDHCVFSNCNTAILVDVPLVQLIHTQIQGQSEYGLYGLSSVAEVQMKSVRINGNAVGVALRNARKTRLLASDLDVSSNTVGLDLKDVEAVVDCSRFIGNVSGIRALASELSLSQLHSVAGLDWLLNGGNCTFIQTEGNALVLDHSLLYLENGQNNFVFRGKKPSKLIIGSVVYSENSHENVSPYRLLGNDNYWYPFPKSGLDEDGNGLYELYFDYPGSGEQENHIIGQCLRNLNTRCYAGSDCHPCAFTTDDTMKHTLGLTMVGDSIAFFPQPADNLLNVVMENLPWIKMEISTLTGQVVLEVFSNGRETTEIPVDVLDSGLYILNIQLVNGVKQRIISIQHH